MAPVAKFELQNRTKDLEINGCVFSVTPGDIDALGAGQTLAERLKGIDLASIEADAYRTLADEIMVAIDGVLGEGACAQILTGRRVNIIDLVELLMFVLRETTMEFKTAVDGLLADLTATVSED
jgi:hypothetical protein